MAKKRIAIATNGGTETRNVLAEIQGSYGLWMERGDAQVIHLATGRRVKPAAGLTAPQMLSVLNGQSKFTAALDALKFGQAAPDTLNDVYKLLCEKLTERIQGRTQ